MSWSIWLFCSGYRYTAIMGWRVYILWKQSRNSTLQTCSPSLSQCTSGSFCWSTWAASSQHYCINSSSSAMKEVFSKSTRILSSTVVDIPMFCDGRVDITIGRRVHQKVAESLWISNLTNSLPIIIVGLWNWKDASFLVTLGNAKKSAHAFCSISPVRIDAAARFFPAWSSLFQLCAFPKQSDAVHFILKRTQQGASLVLVGLDDTKLGMFLSFKNEVSQSMLLSGDLKEVPERLVWRGGGCCAFWLLCSSLQWWNWTGFSKTSIASIQGPYLWNASTRKNKWNLQRKISLFLTCACGLFRELVGFKDLTGKIHLRSEKRYFPLTERNAHFILPTCLCWSHVGTASLSPKLLRWWFIWVGGAFSSRRRKNFHVALTSSHLALFLVCSPVLRKFLWILVE